MISHPYMIITVEGQLCVPAEEKTLANEITIEEGSGACSLFYVCVCIQDLASGLRISTSLFM